MSYQAYPPAAYQAPTPYGYPPPPSYAIPTPTPPPVQQPGYPPPMPQYHSVEHFRAHYAGRLRELTFNSRPIIQELSVSAMNQRDAGNWDFMKVIVEEIEAATVRAHPEAKLPLLYLIDSISKNVGRPFTNQLLPPVLPRLYIYTYRQVNGTTRAKMEEMIALWRTSGPNRDDLYGPAVRSEVESAIFGSNGSATAGGPALHPTQSQVVQMVNGRIQQKQAESSQRPWEERLRHEIGVLQQIAQLLATTQVSGPELQRIADDLGQNVAPVMSPLPGPPPMAAMPPPLPGYPPPPAVVASRSHPTNLPPFAPTLRDAHPNAAPSHLMPPSLATPTHSTSSSTPIPQSSTPLPAPIPTPIIPNIAAGLPANVADILRNLNTSGLLSNPRTPDNAAKGPKGLATYEDMILSLDVRLESLDLNRMTAIPVNHLPQRCKQCGIRFPEDDAKMQAHMDWHFRRNRKERETEGRGAHRRWLPRAEEWISDFANSEAGPSTSSPAKTAKSLPAEKIAAYRKKWVRVPTDARANAPCPICREAWKSEWSEEEEEWVWRNAIDVNGTIYHATCRAEQMFAKKVQKMLNPDGRRTSSKSPRITSQPNEMSVKVEPRGSPARARRDGTPGSVAGKRKAEDGAAAETDGKRVKVEDPEVSNGGEGEAIEVEQLGEMQETSEGRVKQEVEVVTQEQHAQPIESIAAGNSAAVPTTALELEQPDSTAEIDLEVNPALSATHSMIQPVPQDPATIQVDVVEAPAVDTVSQPAVNVDTPIVEASTATAVIEEEEDPELAELYGRGE